jgi:hypothetical protein
MFLETWVSTQATRPPSVFLLTENDVAKERGLGVRSNCAGFRCQVGPACWRKKATLERVASSILILKD